MSDADKISVTRGMISDIREYMRDGSSEVRTAIATNILEMLAEFGDSAYPVSPHTWYVHPNFKSKGAKDGN